MLGANVNIIPPSASREEAMEELKQKLESQRKKVLVIPVGASNAIGSYGYINCYNEIIKQEVEMGIHFDSINLAIGSGGTYAGVSFTFDSTGQLKYTSSNIQGGSSFTMKYILTKL